MVKFIEFFITKGTFFEQQVELPGILLDAGGLKTVK